jgi:hypothetical protein
MKTKKSIAFYVFVCSVLCIIYIAVAARPLDSEYQFIPEWKIDTTVRTAEPAPGSKLIYFKLGQTMGYFTADGKITSFSSYPFKASISPYYYASYPADSSSVPFYNSDGSQAGTINVNGFPFFDGNRIFVFLPGGSSFVKCAASGSVQWSYGGTIPITAFDSSAGGCIVGFADGSVRSFTPEGKTAQQFSPGGSDYPVILGAAISSDGNFIAIVSGRDRQRFVLARKEGDQTKIVFHQFLEKEDPYQKLVQFSSNNKTVYYGSTDMIGIVNTQNGRHASIPVKGQVISVKENGTCLFVLSKNKDKYTVSLIEKFATLSGSFSFTAQTAFIQTDGNMLFVGRDSTISRISIVKE